MLAISIDALNPAALSRLGPERAPALHRLMAEGAFTLNARTQVESTETLPNHTSMVTGRRVQASRGGHGVTWNVHRPGTTVQQAAGHDVSSVFSVAHTAGLDGAVLGEGEVHDLRALLGRRHRPHPDPTRATTAA